MARVEEQLNVADAFFDKRLPASSQEQHKAENSKTSGTAQTVDEMAISLSKFYPGDKSKRNKPVLGNHTSYPKLILERIVSEVERMECDVVNAYNKKQELPASTEELHKAENSKTSEAAEPTDGMTISLSKFFSSDKSSRDIPVFGNHAPQLRILLERVKAEVSEPKAAGRLAKWHKRLRARPPVEKVIEPREEERKTTRIQKKVNYCELSSSDEDERTEDEHIKRKHTDRKYGKWSGESSSENMSTSEDDSSDEDYMQRKRLKLKNESSSNSDRSKTNMPGVRNTIKNVNLSEYEKLRNRNIKEKLAFLEALKFSELEEDL